MKTSKNIFKQVLSIIISILLVFPLRFSAMEPVVVDNASAAKYQANLETARNGVPIINIVKPDTSGLSHNKFLNYNVEKQGLILNNSNQLQATTQLGGVIYGNTNLTNANSANRILNEVTSLNKSTLAGYTEVAGSKASVIVANPNGIFVKGGGFINTPKVTLTTGVPQFTADQLRSYKITQGIIEIGDENFNIENIDKLDLYAKALKFNSKIYVKDINIITGTNDISIDGDVTPIDMVNNDLLSLDSTALGGIYADKIRLIGTSSGVGVNLPAEIIAKDDMIISLDGKLTFKKLLSNGNIDIKSDTINAMDATAETYKNLSIYASDILVDNSNLSSSNNVYINASDSLDITNNSKLTAKNNLDIFAHSQDLKLSNILLSSDNSMKIESKSLINNIDLQANGNLIVKTINGNLVNNKLLQSQKDLTLNIGGDIVNMAAIVSLNDMKAYATNFTNYNTVYSSNNINLHVDNLLLNKTDATKVSGIDNARLYAVENMLLSKDESLQNINEVQNYKGIIQTQKGNIDIFADTLKNITDTTEKIVEVQSTRSVYSSAWWHEYLRGSIYTYIDKNEKFSIAPDKFSSIASANNLSIYSNNLFNYLSDVSAQNNINLAATNISNDSEKLYSTQTTKIQIYNCYSACYSSRSSNPSFRWENYGLPTTVVTGEIGSLDATISAGNNIIGDIANLENVTAHSAVAQNDIFTDIITTKNSTRYIDKDDYVTPTNPYGLFVKSTKHEYLIESNPLYTDISNFIGSEYFLNKMGYDGNAISKRLGDAMYETKLVKDSIKRLSGKEHKEISYVSLMDNAVEISQSVDLKLGKAPTAEQLASIDKDIVWMETKIVDGEEVLVPVVYLADNSNKSSGSVISAGNELNLNVENSIVNSGELTAENNLNISAKSIKNEQGTISSNKDTTINSETSIENITSIITAAGTTNLTAKENIINSNGSTISGKSVNIESTDASVINETSTKTTVVKNDANGNKYEVITTQVGTESKIVSSDGNIFIKAKDNIKNSAANISATNGDINLVTTDGDIELNSKELTDKADFSAGKSFTKTDNTQHISSQLNADSINLQSGSDIQVKASNITAKDTLTLDANKEINILAVNDIEYKDTQSYKKGNFGSSKSKRDMKYEERVVQSNLNANDISLTSKGDINLQSANINAKKTLSATTDGDLNIVAKEYKEGELHESTKKGFLGLSSKVSVDASEYLKLKSSKLTLSYDDFKKPDDAMNLSANNINVVASQLDSENKDINIDAQDSINIVSGIEETNEQHIKESTGLSLGISGGKLTYAQITKDSKIDTAITNKASNINADNIVLTSKGDTNILASNLDAKTMQVTSEKNLNILSDKDVKIHNEEHTKKDIGIELTLNIKEASLFAGYWEDTKGKTTTNKDAVKSTLNIGSLDVSAKDVNIMGSDISANDMSINSQNTKVLSSKSTTDIENYTKSVKSGVSVGVKQNISDTFDSIKNIADAKEATGGISRTLKAYDAVNSFLQKPVDAGVYAIYEQSQTNTKTSMEQAVASNLHAANSITLRSDENIEVAGSSIYAANDLNTEAKNIDIHSTTQNYSQETSFGSRNTKVGLYGTKMGEVTLGFQDASQDTHATTESNSYVVAGNKAIITSEEDTTLKGAIVSASDLEVSTGRNLTMQSVQDTQSIKGKSIGGTVSGNVATMTLNGASVNTGSTKGDKKWVNEVTSLNGENSIKVSVTETTTLKGANITNLDANGMDKGNLQLSTKELKSEDIQDYDNYKSTNIGISIGSVDSTPSLNSIDFTNSTKDKEQIVRATVGEGTLTTNSDTTNLNRDTTKTKEITKDESSNLELYVSESSLKALLNPVQAYNDMKQKAKDVGLASHKEILLDLPSVAKGKDGEADFIDNTIGSLVDAGGKWSFGIIPTVKNDGGYISQIATQVFGDNRDILKTTDESKFIALGLNKDNRDYMQTTIDGETVYLTNPNKTVRIDENINPNDPLKEYKIHLTSQNIKDAGIDTIFTNGLNNLLNEALTNQQQQQGNPTIGMLNYNTSHGTLADLIETGLEKSIITLDTIPGIQELGYMINGSARQTGDSINQLAQINNGNINIAAHSQGTQQTYLGLQQHQKEITQLLKDNPNAVLTLQNSGSPVSSKAVEDLVVNELYGGKNGIEIRFGEGKDDAINVFRSQVNPGDFIGMLGGNFGGINNNAPITSGDFWNQAGYDITRGVPTLMNGSLQNNQNDPTKTSPHSGYPCVIGCGDNGATPKEVFKYYDPNTQENIPLFDYYIKIEVEPSKAKFNTGSN